MRLICIHCVVNSGFKPPLFETYKREIIRVSYRVANSYFNICNPLDRLIGKILVKQKAYGFNYFGLHTNLEKIGLIFQQTTKTFNSISQKFNLIVENCNEESPTDIAYVFSGYAPLSVRFCQYLTKPSWKAYGDVFGLLPGPFVDESQRLPNGLRKRSRILITCFIFTDLLNISLTDRNNNDYNNQNCKETPTVPSTRRSRCRAWTRR